jgi:26S proteasome regulatory subunit N1
VLKIQHLLHICSEHDDSKDQDNNEKKEDKNKKKDDKKDKDKDKEPAGPDLSVQQGQSLFFNSLDAYDLA